MRGFLRIAVLTLAGLCVVTALALWGLYHAAQHEPEFYQAALHRESFDPEEAGDALEQSVLELHNEAREEGQWEAVFTDDQLNGWLAADLPEKFPNLLPGGTKDPRVVIEPELAQVACRYERGNIQTVISFALDVDLTDETNTLAVRVSRLRAGALPVPLRRFLDRITGAAGRADIALRWSVQDGDPVALVTVPVQHEDYAHREIYLETIELREGEIYLAGRTEKSAPEMLVQHASAASSSEEKQAVQR